MSYKIITRDVANASGLKRFYTGASCRFGHDSPRFVSTGACVQCNRVRADKYRKDKQATATARSRGAFVYSLHVDDHAAALAFCQALDLQRGKVPEVPAGKAAQFSQGAQSFEMPEWLTRHRQTLLDQLQKPAVRHIPKEFDK
jgi:hypothetical protein